MSLQQTQIRADPLLIWLGAYYLPATVITINIKYEKKKTAPDNNPKEAALRQWWWRNCQSSGQTRSQAQEGRPGILRDAPGCSASECPFGPQRLMPKVAEPEALLALFWVKSSKTGGSGQVQSLNSPAQ